MTHDTPENPVNFDTGVRRYDYVSLAGNAATPISGGVPEETHVSIYVNGQDVATLMCSPVDQEALALGFLFNEGIIHSMDDLRLIQRNVLGTSVDIFLTSATFLKPRRMVLTTGCGGGVTFQALTDTFHPLSSSFRTSPDVLTMRMRDLNASARLYRQSRGIHTSILASVDRLIAWAEDVGRHNTIDKLMGKALLAGVQTKDHLLLTSGRISSEMLTKARRMEIPIVASRTSPTSISIELAQAWGICIVGYIRQKNMRIYTHPERLGIKLP